MPKIKHETLARFAAYVLRHKPEAIPTATMDREGWMPVTAFVPQHATLEELQEMVAEDTKGRYELRSGPQGDSIRCLYGHSIPNLKIILKTPDAIPDLYHATTKKAYPKIADQGILPMGRSFVHLSSNRAVAVNVALRYAKSMDEVVVLKIVQPETIEGLKLAADEIWVCPKVSPKNFEKES